MDYRIGLKQINAELEKEIEQKLWDKWLTLYPNMRQENFTSFTEFKELHKPKKRLKKLDKKKIDSMVDDIRSRVVSK